jgi:hypothetical protein
MLTHCTREQRFILKHTMPRELDNPATQASVKAPGVGVRGLAGAGVSGRARVGRARLRGRRGDSSIAAKETA